MGKSNAFLELFKTLGIHTGKYHGRCLLYELHTRAAKLNLCVLISKVSAFIATYMY